MKRKSGYVAIVGRPNAGKSTLLNRVLAAPVSIVTPKAQTTRERVLGILTEPQGQMIFVDTPGIHRAKSGGINACMVEEARLGIHEGASLVWYVVDPRSALEHEQAVLELIAGSNIPVFLLISKTDLISDNRRGVDSANVDKLEKDILAALNALGGPEAKSFRISAEKGRGVAPLLSDSWAVLQEGPLYYPDEEQISDRPMRFFAGEKVREQLYLQLGEELPYSCAVEIEKFEESKEPIRIEAIIHVERDSQKGMVIGKGGQKIKSIGTQARLAIEEFIGKKIFLGLNVNVLKDWSRDATALKRLGYHLPEKGNAHEPFSQDHDRGHRPTERRQEHSFQPALRTPARARP